MFYRIEAVQTWLVSNEQGPTQLERPTVRAELGVVVLEADRDPGYFHSNTAICRKSQSDFPFFAHQRDAGTLFLLFKNSIEANMSIHLEQIPFIVVQCPPHGDADFASRWLAAAADADRILTRHRSAYPDFEAAIESVGLINAIEFSWPAMEFIYSWQDSWPAFAFNLFASELVRGLRIHGRSRLFHTDRSTLSNELCLPR